MECCVVVIDQEPAWMQVITLKQISFFLLRMYLFDCAGSQLQHMGSSLHHVGSLFAAHGLSSYRARTQQLGLMDFVIPRQVES